MDKIGTFQKQPSGYKAFIPASFPPKDLIKWDDNLIFLLSQADMAIGKLNEIDKLVPDVDFFIFMYITSISNPNIFNIKIIFLSINPVT